ncbi:hypothetical protein N8T08_011046 [Aspergillus melleus]|uniref:Uncharacterized protein n=1 Tax=Aspergillus melleus TaxID=138277 RepID=A0ACC3AQG7_9EURO|nr:hypothetical protein N8T08_011046 [Aspergillus melleus]
MLHLTLYLSGLLLYIYILTKLLLHATIYLLPSSLSQYISSKPNAPESWALITGSTAGIGFGFAQELLSRGFNVIIHGKSTQELEHARTQLRLSFPHSSIRIFQYDAASFSNTTLDESLAKVLQGISLRVLINNVGGQAGQTRSTYQRLTDFSDKEVSRVMNVNAHFMTQITRIILPRFLSTQSTQKKEEEKERLPCLILNISSLSAIGLPYLSVYAASKAYVDAFTRSLHAEMLAEKTPVGVLGVSYGTRGAAVRWPGTTISIHTSIGVSIGVGVISGISAWATIGWSAGGGDGLLAACSAGVGIWDPAGEGSGVDFHFDFEGIEG